MKRGIAFLGLAICLFVMNSCAGFGALVTVTAFGVEAYEEALELECQRLVREWWWCAMGPVSARASPADRKRESCC